MLQSLSITALLTTAAATDTYQFPPGKSPYNDRNNIARHMNEIHVTPKNGGSPHDGHIYYPDTPGKYPWIDFQGGMDGMFPEFLYDDLFKDIVYSGFIITYTNPHLLIEHKMNNFSLWSEQAYFYQNSGPALVQELSQGQVEFDTSNMAIVCHSSGCQPSKEFGNNNGQRVQAFHFLDPVYQFGKEVIATTPVYMQDTQSVVVQSSELCKGCCTTGYADWAGMTFDSFSGGSIKTHQTMANQGHCSPLTYFNAQLCRVVHFCQMPDNITTRGQKHVHKCLAGMMIAQFTDSFFPGRSDIRKYYTEEQYMCDDYLVPDTYQCDGDWCL